MNKPDFARHVNLYFTLGACWVHWRKSENHCFHSKNSNQQWIMLTCFNFCFFQRPRMRITSLKTNAMKMRKPKMLMLFLRYVLFLIKTSFLHTFIANIYQIVYEMTVFFSPFSRPLLMTSLHLRVVFHYFHLCHHTTVNLRNPSCRPENQSQYFRFPSFAFHFSVVVSR